MAFCYFTWKNGIKAEKKDSQEWTEITKNQYLQICDTNKNLDIENRRFFEKVPGIAEGDDTYYFECDYQESLKADARAKARKRRRDNLKELKETGKMPELISFDAEYFDESGESYTLHDLVADKDSLFENDLVEMMDLHNALDALSEEEMKIIGSLFLFDDTLTEREYAEQIGVSKTAVNYRKKKIFEKMKKFLDQN